MKQRIQTEAVVVLRHERGEADRLVVILSKDRGKLTALARGARRSQKRFGGCLELGSLIEVVLTDTGRGSWLQIEEAQLLDGHQQVKSDLLRIAQMAYCCELAAALVPEGQADKSVFDELVKILATLNQRTLGSEDLRAYELVLVSIVGFAPHLTCCVTCGQERSAHWFFDPVQGGIVCQACADVSQSIALGPEALKLLRALQAGEKRPQGTPTARLAVREALARLIDCHVSAPLQSKKFLRQVVLDNQRTKTGESAQREPLVTIDNN
jgi:DNA repair protein RecO (recombination protein O)